MIKKVNILIFILVIMVSPLRAEEIEIKAYVDNRVIGLNRQFNLHIELSGKNINNAGSPQLPDMDKFASYLGSSSSQNIQFINGRMSASKIITYHFQAISIGEFSIEPIVVKSGNIEYKTESIKIKIEKDSRQAAAGISRRSSGRGNNSTSDQSSIEDKLFLRAIIDKKKCYQNESVFIIYKIYTSLSISSYQLSKLPSAGGFLVEEFEIGRNPSVSREIIDGKQFTVAVIRKAAFFPVTEGEKIILPLEIKCQIKMRRSSRDIFDDFFSDPFGRTVEKIVRSNSVKIDVLPLPEKGKPEGFTGTVGDFSIKGYVDKKKLSTDDAVTYTVKISGTGHISSLPQPDVEFSSDFETYKPEIKKNINRKGRRVTGSKIFEYVLIPRKAGKLRIKSIKYPVFDPVAKSYKILSTDEIILNVAEGKNKTSIVHTGLSKKEIDLIGRDIRFIKTELDFGRRISGSLFVKLLFWIIFAVPLIFLVIAILYRKYRDKLHGDKAYARDRFAGRQAKKHLSAAKLKMNKSDQKEFYAEIKKAIAGFISDKLNIFEAGMIKDDVGVRLKERGISEKTYQDYRVCLEKCNMIRFAPSGSSEEEMRLLFRNAESILSRLEKELTN